jgi:hypothetical protein
MGQYWDYFRAKDAAKARSIAPKGRLKDKKADFVSLKAFDHKIQLGLMLTFATNATWTPDAVQTRFVWPSGSKPETFEDWEQLPDNSPWHSSDYFLEEFAQEFRDSLASLGEPHFQRLEQDWAPDENFDGYDLDEVRAYLRDLVNLAKRARGANEQLFVCVPNG